MLLLLNKLETFEHSMETVATASSPESRLKSVHDHIKYKVFAKDSFYNYMKLIFG